jgi:hypothetical protein
MPEKPIKNNESNDDKEPVDNISGSVKKTIMFSQHPLLPPDPDIGSATAAFCVFYGDPVRRLFRHCPDFA